MNTTVISSLISALAALAVCLINNHFTRAEQDKKNESTIALVTYRLEQLEKKVDKHNDLIERTYKLEESHAVMDEQIKVANHRISDLEKSAV